MNYGKAIRIGRAIRNFSQNELAQLVKVNASFISLIEKGQRLPSVKTLQKCSIALSIPYPILLVMASNKKELEEISDKGINIIGEDLINLIIKA